MDKNTYVVIMAGGIGSRIWPYSREKSPKQFQDLLGTGSSLLQHTADRFIDICPMENIYIVTNADFAGLVKEQLPELSDDQILLEPEGRNTAPCIAYASYKIASKNPDARIVITPSDHLVLKEREFRSKISTALTHISEEDNIVTLGIKPHRPNTGYGYINFQPSEEDVIPVKAFTEKPDTQTAIKFVESGEYVWNAGIFIWSAKTIVSAFEKHLPELHSVFSKANDLYYTADEKAYIDGVYPNCSNISIDYGVMEKADNVLVVLADVGWSDLGTWNSIYEIQSKDENGNVIEGNVRLYEASNNLVKTPSNKLVVIQGLQNYIVAEHSNVLMICDKEKEQMVKEFVKDIKGTQFS